MSANAFSRYHLNRHFAAKHPLVCQACQKDGCTFRNHHHYQCTEPSCGRLLGCKAFKRNQLYKYLKQKSTRLICISCAETESLLAKHATAVSGLLYSMRSNYKPTSLTDSTLCVRHVNKMVAHPRTRDAIDAQAHGAVHPLVAKLPTTRRCIHISKGTRTCYARHAFQSYSHCKQRPKPATRRGASAGEEHHLRRVRCTERRHASTPGSTSCKQRSRCGCRNILRAKGARRRLKLRDEDANRCGLISAPSRPRSVPPKKTIHAIYTSQLPVSCIPVYLYICIPYIRT